jgi:retron-type reverse transcriptase
MYNYELSVIIQNDKNEYTFTIHHAEQDKISNMIIKNDKIDILIKEIINGELSPKKSFRRLYEILGEYCPNTFDD